MRDNEKAPRTISYALTVIQQIFNWSIKMGLYEGKNPVASVSKPKQDNRRTRHLEEHEAKALLNTILPLSLNVHDMALLGLFCGLRFGEIANLTWDCVDFKTGTIHIKDTKSGRNRTAYMHVQEVQTMLGRRKLKSHSGLIFKNKSGDKITSVSHTFQRVVNDLKLNEGVTDNRHKVVFHTLRHTFASWLACNGTSLYTIKELMGHSRMEMTERYSHLSPNLKSDAAASLNGILGKKPDKLVGIKVAKEGAGTGGEK